MHRLKITLYLELVFGHVLILRLSRIKRSQVMSMGKGGRGDIILLDSNGDNDAEDVADADYFADEAADVSGKSSLSQ